MNSALIRITHDAAADAPLRLQNVRLNVVAGEPEALRDVVDVAPGETVTVLLQPGGAMVLSEPTPC